MEFPDTLETQITNKIMRIFTDVFGSEPVVHLQGAKYNRVFEHVHKTLSDFSLLSTGGSIGEAINTKSIGKAVLITPGRKKLTIEDLHTLKEAFDANPPIQRLPPEDIMIKPIELDLSPAPQAYRESLFEEKCSPIYTPKHGHKRHNKKRK